MASGSYLPEDMVREIMLRLPVQSLLRFKAVRKDWLALITSSSFIHTHCCQHRPKHSIMLTSPARDDRGISLLQADSCELDNQNLPSFMMNNDTKQYCTIAGSSNGLLCVYFCNTNSVDCFLCNLATRDYRLLPSPPKRGASTYITNGFGFVPAINDYRLLIVEDEYSDQSHLNITAVVYTLSTDSWNEVEGIAYNQNYCLGPEFSVVVHGKWYQLIFPKDKDIEGSGEVPSILRFDMGKNIFSKMEGGLPCDNYDSDKRMHLMVYKESLAMGVIRNEESTFELEIWTLTKNEDCWTKLFICTTLPKTMKIIPLGFRNDKEIIISDYCLESYYDQLQLYDPLTQQSIMLSTRKDILYYQAHNYVETLVSVFGRGPCMINSEQEKLKRRRLGNGFE